MNKLILILGSVLIISGCGPSQEERNRVAAVTCSIMGETRNMDAAVRVEKMNEARDKIGGEPFLRGDDPIKEALKWGLCQELVLNERYDEALESLKVAERERIRILRQLEIKTKIIEAEELANKQKIAAEKLAKKQKIAAEKQRIADSKPTVREEFHVNGQLKSRRSYQSKADGEKKHGLTEVYHENGQLDLKVNFIDGKRDGIFVSYHENGQLSSKVNFIDGRRDGIFVGYFESGQLARRQHYKAGDLDGLMELNTLEGGLVLRCYRKNNLEINMSYCER